MNEKSLNSKYSNHFPNNEFEEYEEYKEYNEYKKYDSKDLKEISNHLLYHKFTMINEILDKRYKRDNPEMKFCLPMFMKECP